MAFKVQVQADGTGQWYDNAIRLRSQEEAERYAFDWLMRWTAMREYRVVEVDEPANYHLVDGCLTALPAEA